MHALFFDMQPKAGHMPHYFEHVDRLRPLLAAHEGLLYLERFRPLDRPDAILSHQHWAGEAAIRAWRCDGTHRASQAAGRSIHFEAYRIRVGPEVRPEGAGRFVVVGDRILSSTDGRTCCRRRFSWCTGPEARSASHRSR